MTLLSNLDQRIEYFKSFINNNNYLPNGSHNSNKNIRGNLGYYMKQLKESEHNSEKVDELLTKIHSEMKLENSLEDFKKEYEFYLRLLVNRQNKIEDSGFWGYFKLDEIDNLNKSNWNNWGSYRQFCYGKYTIDAINKYHKTNLHPIWGCLLNPTGGIIGSGNTKLLQSDWDSSISMHSCVHDAGGYLYKYHNIGPGYNYLNTKWTIFPTWYQMSCQVYGIKFWNKLI